MREVLDIEAEKLCELVSRLLAMREMGKDEVPLGGFAQARLASVMADVRKELARRSAVLAPIPCDLHLSNGMPCIDVDHEAHSIGVIVPEGFCLIAITPSSNMELLTEPRVLRDKTYATGHVLRTVVREPLPTIASER